MIPLSISISISIFLKDFLSISISISIFSELPYRYRFRYRYFPELPYRYRYRYFQNDHIDIDIFQKCRYIDNRYSISIYRTGLGGDSLLDKRAGEVLAWGLRLLEQGTFERGDYKQLLILTVVWLGGKECVENFRFAKPGAHHFARF